MAAYTQRSGCFGASCLDLYPEAPSSGGNGGAAGPGNGGSAPGSQGGIFGPGGSMAAPLGIDLWFWAAIAGLVVGYLTWGDR